jgi:hypothetical protein
MCLGNGGDIFVANRGNENTFAMRVNRVKIGGPGEEELLAEFYGRTPSRSSMPQANSFANGERPAAVQEN